MKKDIRNLLIIGGFALFVFAAIPSTATAQTTHEVAVTNNKFTPKDITIQVGDIVKWTNTQGFHNVNGQKSTYPNNPASFGNSTGTGWTYSFTFTQQGKYDYQCDPHVGLGMVGTVTVVDDSNFLSLKVNFESMNPHIGQRFTMYIKNLETGAYVDSLILASIPGSDFDLETDFIESGSSYHIDFYADHNGNGKYDAPPADHAWRLETMNVTEDTELTFIHNTNFTDIMAGSSGVDIDELVISLKAYPNPVFDILTIEFDQNASNSPSLRLINVAGQDVKSINVNPGDTRVDVDMSSYQPGVYFLNIIKGDSKEVVKIVKR